MSSPHYVDYVELSDLSQEVRDVGAQDTSVFGESSAAHQGPAIVDDSSAEASASTGARTFAERCKICNSKAFGFNYLVVSCNACKMFFRRVIVDNLEYTCRLTGNCFDNIENQDKRPKCKACRFKKCISVGMKFLPHDRSNETEQGIALPQQLVNPEDMMFSLVGPLLHLDSQREFHFQNIYTNVNPSMAEILSRPVKGFSGPIFGLEKDIPLDQWSFFSIMTSVEFLGNLDFMAEIDLPDKEILVKNFAMKSSFMACCFRSMQNRYDRLVNPNGMDIYPDTVLQIPAFSLEFLNRIRKLLITRLIELRITQEEYILAVIILFCNTAHSGLSPRAQEIVNFQQKRHCAALLRHCLSKYQRNGPARLNEILSLGNMLTRVFQDVQSLVTIFQMFVPTTTHYTLIQEAFPNTVL